MYDPNHKNPTDVSEGGNITSPWGQSFVRGRNTFAPKIVKYLPRPMMQHLQGRLGEVRLPSIVRTYVPLIRTGYGGPVHLTPTTAPNPGK